MKYPRWLLVGLALMVVGPVRAQVPPEKSVATFQVSDPALEIALWASEPLFVNPTCMDIDPQGRVWVCESVNYRHKLHHQPPRRPAGDRIVILEDTKGSGRADKATTFYQSPDTLAPLGIAVAKDLVGPGYKVFVCQSPDILVFEDKDGDGKADGPPRKLLSGFGGYDHDHGVHGILIGPDGRLYFSIGDTGVDGLVDKNGKIWKTNQTDCRAGTIWRCDLDGKNLELIAHNFRNEYEPCVDSFGTVFVSDNDDDGNQQTRICYVMPGGNYGYWPRGPGQSHWHEEQPGVVPKILRTYFGSPTGICVYEGTLLPEKYRGQLLHTDAGPRHLRCYHLKPEGAGYAVDRDDVVTSTDNWFRPSDVCVAPDGSVYVADWYDPGVGGHGMGDTTRGRIFRISPKGNRPRVPAIDLESREGLTGALASPALSVRYLALAKLRNLDDGHALAVLEAAAVQKDNAPLRARALWELGRFANQGKRFIADAFTDPDPRFRILAIRIEKDLLKRSPADYNAQWQAALLADPSAGVRREALLALRDVDAAKAKPLIIELAKKYAGNDRFYLETIGIAVGHDKIRRDVILSDFGKEFATWNEQVADLIWELQPPQMLVLLERKLVDGNLPAAQRKRILDILASSEQVEAGSALLKSLRSEMPAETRDHIIENLELSLPGKWRSLRQSPELGETVNHLLIQAATRPAALILIAAAEMTDALPKVAALADDGKESLALRQAAIHTMGRLEAAATVPALEKLLQASPVELRTEAVRSLGQLASPKALELLHRLTMAGAKDLILGQTAVAALAGSRKGSVWLLQAHHKRLLPDALTADVGRVLRNSPYQDLRNKALIAFPAPGKLDPKKLPGIAALAYRKGEVNHGRDLLAASAKNDVQCLKCHTVRGVGGNVGPDLSVIGKKASRENLFESILYPSKAIADQYINWQIETKNGLVLNGLMVEETVDQLTLRDANAKDTRIAKKDIETRTKSPNSLMPNDLLAFMTEDELVDIVEYLFSLKTSILGMDYWHIVGPFDNGMGDAGLDQVFGPEKEINLKASYPGKLGPVAWRKVKPDDKGYVDLQAFLAPNSDEVVSYLYREVESPAEQEAVVQLGTDDCAKLWINGKLVYTNRQHRAAAPEQESVKVKLQKGRNPLLLKITNGNGGHGFYLTLQAEQELKRVESK
jgi:putative membrane-bound dehydrogenase-like protein